LKKGAFPAPLPEKLLNKNKMIYAMIQRVCTFLVSFLYKAFWGERENPFLSKKGFSQKEKIKKEVFP